MDRWIDGSRAGGFAGLRRVLERDCRHDKEPRAIAVPITFAFASTFILATHQHRLVAHRRTEQRLGCAIGGTDGDPDAAADADALGGQQ